MFQTESHLEPWDGAAQRLHWIEDLCRNFIGNSIGPGICFGFPQSINNTNATTNKSYLCRDRRERARA